MNEGNKVVKDNKAKEPTVENTVDPVIPNVVPIPISEIVDNPVQFIIDPAAPVSDQPKPDKKPIVPPPGKNEERKVDNKENALRFKEKWDELKNSSNEAKVNVPGTRRSVSFAHVEVVENKISIWTSTEKELPPDYVIVNAPTEFVNADGQIIDDPLTTIALAIDGAEQ